MLGSLGDIVVRFRAKLRNTPPQFGSSCLRESLVIAPLAPARNSQLVDSVPGWRDSELRISCRESSTRSRRLTILDSPTKFFLPFSRDSFRYSNKIRSNSDRGEPRGKRRKEKIRLWRIIRGERPGKIHTPSLGEARSFGKQWPKGLTRSGVFFSPSMRERSENARLEGK